MANALRDAIAGRYQQGTGQTADAATLAELERLVNASGGMDQYIAQNFQNWSPDVQANLGFDSLRDQVSRAYATGTGAAPNQADSDYLTRHAYLAGGVQPLIQQNFDSLGQTYKSNLAAPYQDEARQLFSDITGEQISDEELNRVTQAMAKHGGFYPALAAEWQNIDPTRQRQLIDWKTAQEQQTRASQLSGVGNVNALRGDFMSELENIIGPAYQRPDFNFEADPGYQFRLDEGTKALQRGQLARGDFFSGGAMKELADFSQNTASNEFDRSFNRYLAGVDRDYAATQDRTGQRLGAWGQSFGNAAALENQGWGRGWVMDERDYTRDWNANQRDWDRFSQLSGAGQGAAAGTAGAGQNYANNAGNAYMQGANAQAGGYINAANAWTNAGQNALTAYYNSKRPMINYGGYGGY